MSYAMRWGTTLAPPLIEYFINNTIEIGYFIFLLYLMPIDGCLHLFYYRIPYFIQQMKSGSIIVTYSNHAIYMIHERKNVIYFISPYIIQNYFFHICNFSNIIFSITIPLITNDHILQKKKINILNLFSITFMEAK